MVGVKRDVVVLGDAAAFLLEPADALPDLVELFVGPGSGQPLGELGQCVLEAFGEALDDATLDDGEKVEAGKTYKVAGWATVNAPSAGPPIWDVVAEYLRDRGSARIGKLNTPRLVNVEGNPGIADHGG